MTPRGVEKPGKSGRNGVRDAKGHFLPGNPGGGRPAVARDFRERCQGFMEREGWALLEADARRPGRAGHQARELIAAYAYGKPKQGVELTGEAGAALAVTYIAVPGATPGV